MNAFWNDIIGGHARAQLAVAVPDAEPRWCYSCDEEAEPDQRTCLYCSGPTITVSDRDEAAWQRQQEDYASEPPVTVDELHARAWLEREALRTGRVL